MTGDAGSESPSDPLSRQNLSFSINEGGKELRLASVSEKRQLTHEVRLAAHGRAIHYQNYISQNYKRQRQLDASGIREGTGQNSANRSHNDLSTRSPEEGFCVRL